MSDSRKAYFSYLLRMWRAGDETDGEWRASMENAQTGEREVFSGVEAVVDFIRQQAGETSDPQGKREDVPGAGEAPQ
jgi:hypothetical protein